MGRSMDCTIAPVVVLVHWYSSCITDMALDEEVVGLFQKGAWCSGLIFLMMILDTRGEVLVVLTMLIC